jgi:hypothetical protein
MPGWSKLGGGVPDNEDRTGRTLDHPLGHAAEVDAMWPSATYLANDDQVHSLLTRQFGDFSVGNAMPDRLVGL